MTATSPVTSHEAASATAWFVIFGTALAHLLNDLVQSLVTASYPVIEGEFGLLFWQIGLITFAFQVTASVLQPVVGHLSDRHPLTHALGFGMALTLLGLVLLAEGPGYGWLLAGAVLIGIGSAVFHPEASRVARAASGGRFGTAQSLFQVGGNLGTAIGPLLAAFVVVVHGRQSLIWFSACALLGLIVLVRLGAWHAHHRAAAALRPAIRREGPVLPRRTVATALVVLALLTFSKNIYTAAFGSYYTFFLIERFGLTAQQSQLMLFLFLGAMAVGVALGGPIGDRFGPLAVIWGSILGVLPFTILLPFATLFWTAVLSVVIGIVIASAFPAIVVYAIELVPGRIGLISGLFFGFAFGMGGIAAAVLGVLADLNGLRWIFVLCSWLPAIGILTVFLPRRSLVA
jgi:FSR family fosmidomycin resistance protein-like MFS transporter